MEKKPEPEQRVKDNAKPSSSARAAELMQQVSSSFVGFSLNSLAPIGAGMLLDDAFDASLDGDLKMSLRKLSKKDPLTKCKALDELKSLVDAKSLDDCIAILPYWAKSFTKLALDSDRKVRELCQQTHEKLCSKVNKSLAPYLKQLMPYWLMAQSDTYSQAGKIADASFKAIFNELKRPEVIYFARDDILNVFYDFLVNQSIKNDLGSLSKDEADQRYELMICVALRGLDLFLKYYADILRKKASSLADNKTCLEKLDSLLTDQKFWKYAKEPSLKIRSDFYQLVYSLVTSLLVLENDDLNKLKVAVKAKIVPLVFYAIDEDNNACCHYVWQSISKCLELFASDNEFWTLFNVKKAFWPKLFTLLRHHASGTANSQNVDVIFSNLLQLLQKQAPIYSDTDEMITFYNEFLAKLFDCFTYYNAKSSSKLPKARLIQSSPLRIRVIDAFFSCFAYIVHSVLEANRFDNCSNLIGDYLMKSIYDYLEDKTESTTQDLETRMHSMFNELFRNEQLRELFYQSLSNWIEEKLNSNDAPNHLTSKFCALFQHSNQVDRQFFAIVEKIFTKQVLTFHATMLGDHTTAIAYLRSISQMLNELYDDSLLNILQKDRSDSFMRDEIGSIFVKLNDSDNDQLKLSVLNLFLVLNSKAKQPSSTLDADIDRFLFELSNIGIKNFIGYYFVEKETTFGSKRIEQFIFKWLFSSEKFKRKMLENFFTASNLFDTRSTHEMVIHFMHSLSTYQVDPDLDHLKSSTIQMFNQSLIQTVLDFIAKTKSDNNNNNTESIQNLVKFMLAFVYGGSETKIITDLKTSWLMLLNSIQLHISLGDSLVDFDQLLDKSGSLLVKQLLEKSSVDPNDFRPFLDWQQQQQQQSSPDTMIKLTIVLSSLLKRSLPRERKMNWMFEFYQKVLFSVENRATIRSGIAHLQQSSSFLANFYLDKRFNFAFARLFPQLLDNDGKTAAENSLLEHLEYGVAILGDLSSTSESEYLAGFIEHIIRTDFNSQQDSFNLEDLFNILISSVMLNYIDPSNLVDESAKNRLWAVRDGLNKILGESDFILTLIQLLNKIGLKAFISHLLSDQLKFHLKLNEFSMFISIVTQLRLDDPNYSNEMMRLVKNFVLTVADLNGGLNLKEIQYYLFDLPFVKRNYMNELANKKSAESFHSLLVHLIQMPFNQLIECGKQLIELDLSCLAKFNFNFDLFLRYVKSYVDMLVESSSPTNLANKHLNTSQETMDFLRTKLAGCLNQVLAFFIELKNKIKAENAKNNVKSNPFTFFFQFESSKDDWQKFLLVDKLNTFLKMLFVDFKLYLKKTATSQTINSADEIQLSELLNDKSWDFILCYTVSIVQQLNVRDSSALVDSTDPSIQIFAINFFDYVYSMINCLKVRVRDNRSGSYPPQIYSEWSVFFSKEIFDPTLCLFVKLANITSASPSSMSILSLKLIKSLSATISTINYERLSLNDLEPKFNVLDNIIADSATVITLNDKLKTVFNHLTGHLSHEIPSIQLATYKVLKEIMKNVSTFYSAAKSSKKAEDDECESDCSKQKEPNIIESMPQIVRNQLKQSIEMFSDIKLNFAFDQSILILDATDVKMHHDANKTFMAYMLVNRLILDMFSTDDLEFKVNLVNNLREIDINDSLMHFLFRIMPSFREASNEYFAQNLSDTLEDLDDLDFESIMFDRSNDDANRFDLQSIDALFMKKPDKLDSFVSFTNRNVQLFGCKLYKHALRNVPAMIRDWWNIQPKKIADCVDKYTQKYVSPVLLEEEMKVINRYNQQQEKQQDPFDETQSQLRTKGIFSSREIISTYKMKELNMELIIQLPVNHPLGVVEVKSVRRIGVDEKQWRNWLLQLTTYLTHQNGSLTQSLQIWKRNVDKKFSGVEECTICYAVIHGTNYQLPKIKCRTCRKLFHSICLYKWFESSSKSTCPLCRNLFYM